MPGIDIQQDVVGLTTGGVSIAGLYFSYRIRAVREREKSVRARIRSTNLENSLRSLPPGGAVIEADSQDGCRQEVLMPLLISTGAEPCRPLLPSPPSPSEQDPR
jgi:hypothetical protein